MSRREPFAMIPFSLFECCQDFNALHLYAWLRRHANRQGVTTTATPKLAREMGTSQRSFERALAQLRAAGFVHTKRRHRDDGSVAGLTFTVFDSRQNARLGGLDQSAKSGGKVANQTASFRPPKPPDLAPLEEVDLLYVDLKDLKAGSAPAPPTRPEQKSAPTAAHVTLFVAELAAKRSYEYNGGTADLMEDLKTLFAQRNFDYAAVPRSLPGWFNSACVQVGALRRRHG